MNAYWAIGWLLAVPACFRIYRGLRPFRVDASDTSHFAAVGRTYTILAVTGRAHDVTKRTTTTIKGELTVYEGTGHGSVRSKTTIHDQFFVTDAQGTDHAFQLSDFDAAIAPGQVVSVVWAIRRWKKTGKYFMVANHTTGQRFFNDNALYRISISHRILANVQIVVSLIFVPAVVLLLVWGMTLRIQMRRFKTTGVTPLVNALEPASVQLPPRVDDLERLATLARDGLLTDEEWTRAKELFLGKRPDARELALGHLKQVYSLYREGALSEGEFNGKKWEILARESRAH